MCGSMTRATPLTAVAASRYWGDVKPDVRKEFMSTVCSGLESVLTAVRKAGDDQESAPARRNAFKMFVFLITEVRLGVRCT